MESCSSSLYTLVQNNTEITLRICNEVLYNNIEKCDFSYLYLNRKFLYTFVCPKTTKVTPMTNFAKNNTNISNNNTNNYSSYWDFIKNNRTKNNSKEMNGSKIVYYNTTLSNSSSIVRHNTSTQKLYTFDYFPIIIGIVILFVLACASYIIYIKTHKRHIKKKKRPSYVMPDVVKNNNGEKSENTINREVRCVIQKIVNTICKRNGEITYRHTNAPQRAPPIPPRPPIDLRKRDQTLQFLRQTNPHSRIRTALNKPAEFNQEEAGRRRAELLKREALLQAEKQRKQKNRQSRLKRIVRLRQLQSKKDDE